MKTPSSCLYRVLPLSLMLAGAVALPAQAADYVIDTKGAHAFIQFKISHLGYSYELGRFNKFSGNFSYDEAKPEDAKVSVTIDTSSIDTNHAERDKHLRGSDFLDVKKYPQASFVSTRYKPLGNNKAELQGNLTLHGVTKPITIQVNEIGHGPDPWGGYRRGFEGFTTLTLADYGITYDLGPASRTLDMHLIVEGIRQ